MMRLAWVVVAGILLWAGVMVYKRARWLEPSSSRKKKETRPSLPSAQPAVPTTDLAVRYERRYQALDKAVQAARQDQRAKEREIEQLKAVVNGLERQVEQAKAWQDKEEALAAREQQTAQDLRAELQKTREALHETSNQRIKLEYEVKELRLLKENNGSDIRKLTGQHHELNRRFEALTREVRELKVENVKLKQKKEADQWVAKDEFVRVGKLLKRARWEVERLQQRLPEELRDPEKNVNPKE